MNADDDGNKEFAVEVWEEPFISLAMDLDELPPRRGRISIFRGIQGSEQHPHHPLWRFRNGRVYTVSIMSIRSYVRLDFKYRCFWGPVLPSEKTDFLPCRHPIDGQVLAKEHNC
jgi:hypothetical protein